jgi:large subunit ribosomal protein L22
MKVEASLNNLRIAPRKVRLVAHSIVGLPVQVALAVLAKQVKRSSAPMETLLKSAIANATHNFDLDQATLVIRSVSVGDGLRLKRFMPKAFGQATQILKRSSKIRIILEGEKAVVKKVEKSANKEGSAKKKTPSGESKAVELSKTE